jgi:ethanolamine permease
MIGGALVALVIMLGIWFALGADEGTATIGGMLLNMAVFGAMCSYIFQAVSFIMLRQNLPDIARPYRSPLGNAGAVATIVIALVTIAFQLIDPVYRQGVYGVALWFAVGIAYFAAIGRNSLVLSPEEEFAMSKGTTAYRSD